MNKTWAIVVIAVIISASVAIFGFSNDTQSTVSEIESNDIKSQGVTTTLTPEIITIESTSQVISSEDYTGDVTTDQMKTQSYLPVIDFEKAYAVTSSQSSITVTTWESGNFGHGFDSSWNMYSAVTRAILFSNVSDNTRTGWTLPNDDKVNSSEMVVDSNGDLFFGKMDKNNNNKKITKLNPSTNVFTEYNTNVFSSFLVIDSSDNIFFNAVNSVHKLVPSTNTLISWDGAAANGSGNIQMDESGNIYFSIGPPPVSVGRFDVNTNTLTKWTIPDTNSIFSVTFDSSGNIFFISLEGPRNNLGRITISDNVLTEWVVPFGGGFNDILVDSNGNVFFGRSDALFRFVPSTDTFTFFQHVECSFAIEIDSSDDIYCVDDTIFSKIT